MHTKRKHFTSNKRKTHHKYKKNNRGKTKRVYNKIKQKVVGGDIYKTNVFTKILSIGYELETSSLAKLTLISGDENILLNTSSNSKDYEIIKKIQDGELSGDEYDKYDNRLDELIEVDSYTSESINNSDKSKLVKNVDTTFLLANDLTVSPFTKYLNVFCDLEQDNNEKNNVDSNDNNNNDHEDLLDKNELYTFETNDGVVYKINFETSDKQDCGTFADVEWIMTYYKPEISENIILNTFINVITPFYISNADLTA